MKYSLFSRTKDFLFAQSEREMSMSIYMESEISQQQKSYENLHLESSFIRCVCADAIFIHVCLQTCLVSHLLT